MDGSYVKKFNLGNYKIFENRVEKNHFFFEMLARNKNSVIMKEKRVVDTLLENLYYQIINLHFLSGL